MGFSLEARSPEMGTLLLFANRWHECIAEVCRYKLQINPGGCSRRHRVHVSITGTSGCNLTPAARDGSGIFVTEQRKKTAKINAELLCQTGMGLM